MGSAKAVKEYLADQGILVRYYEAAMLNDFIRISVGRPQDTDKLITALQVFENKDLHVS
jgi:histidinol-phosphate aminotransferase